MDLYNFILLIFQYAISGRPTGDCVTALQNKFIVPSTILLPVIANAITYLGTNPVTLSAGQITQMTAILTTLQTTLQSS